MRSEIDCLLCLLKQSLNTVRLSTDDRTLQRRVIDETAAWIGSVNLDRSPAEISTRVYRLVSEITGIKDPFRTLKASTNDQALALLPQIREWVKHSPDPLAMALHVSAAGNVVDLGIGSGFDLFRDVRRLMDAAFAVDHTEDFRKEIQPGRTLLILGDNSGEIVLDRILVEVLIDRGMDIVYAVKSGPIINDALVEDAVKAGLTDLVRVIETGSDDIGVRFDRVSSEFLEALQSAHAILAKGHGHFESCDDRPENFYFLLKAKCPVVARALGVKEGDVVFRHGKG